MLTYTWKINSLSKQDNPSAGLNNVVVQTFWECKGVDADGISGTFYGGTDFRLDDADPDNFIPYEELTEAEVLGWVQASVNNVPGYQAQINNQIQRQIDLTNHPISIVISEQFPWVEPSANNAPTANT